MNYINAYAATSAKEPRKPFSFDPGELGRSISVHGIPKRRFTEMFPMSKVNDAIEHLRAGKARYRIVLENDLA